MKIIYFLAFIIILIGCSFPEKKKEERSEENKINTLDSDYVLNFQKVDNLAKVYIEDSLVFTSQLVHGNPDVDYYFDFEPFLINGNEILRIELYNGEPPYNLTEDPHWEIRYYIIIKGEIVEFVHDSNDDNQVGKGV